MTHTPRRPVGRALALLSLLLAALPAGAYEDPNSAYRLYSRCWRPYEADNDTLGLFHLDGKAAADLQALEGGGDLDALLDGEDAGGLVTASVGKEPPRLPPGSEGEEIPDAANEPLPAFVRRPFAREDDGRFGGALRLEGRGAAIVTPVYSALPAGGQFAVEAWVRPQALGGELFHLPGPVPLVVELREDGGLLARYGEHAVRSRAGALRVGVWQHVALTVTPSAAALRSLYGTRTFGRAGLGARSTGRFRRKAAEHPPQLRLLLGGRVVAQRDDPALPKLVRRLAGAVWVGNNPAGAAPCRAGIDQLRISGRARLYYVNRLDEMLATAGPDFPTGQPALRDAADEAVHLDLDGTLPDADAAGTPAGEAPPAVFAPGVHGRSAVAGPAVRAPVWTPPPGLAARHGTLDLWFSPDDWDNGKLRFRKETIHENPPVEMVPILRLSSRGPDGGEARPLLTVAAHTMWPEIGTPDPMLVPGRWYHLTVTFDHGRARVYLDGAPLAAPSLVVRAAPPPADHVLARLRVGGQVPWRGRDVRIRGHTLLDEVRWYRRPLTPVEVANGHARFRPGEALTPLPAAHLGVAFEPVAGRLFLDATALLPAWPQVDRVAWTLAGADGAPLAAGELGPFVDGRAWSLTEDLFPPAGDATLSLRCLDGAGTELAVATRGVALAARPFAEEVEPTPYRFAYYPTPKALRFQLHPVWTMAPVRSDFLRTAAGKPGLTGRYYDNRACTGEPLFTRTDPAVAFAWPEEPGPLLPADSFGVVWEGTLGPAPCAGEYTIAVPAKGGVRLWLDGELRLDTVSDPQADARLSLALAAGATLPLRLEYRHGRGDAACRLQWRVVPDDPQALPRTIGVRVTDEADATLFERTGNINPADESYVTIEDVPDGRYKVLLRMPTGTKEYVRWFHRKHFAWEGNTLGITDEVLPPFTPLTVAGRTVGVVLREYDVGGLGLWTSVRARSNDGGPRELLARPITLVVNGDTPLTGEGEFVEQAAHQVLYAGRATHPAVNVRSRCATEYDGCLKVELTLEPGTEPLESLALEIPLRDEMAPLWHVLTTGIRGNPAGAAPGGTGQVWNSAKLRDGNWPGNFKHYLWFGAEERGLCWFADNEAGWVVDWENQPPCQTLHREDGELVLRVHLVQKPIRLTEPRTITFGLMASPAKPMPGGWRAIGRPEVRGIRFTMGHYFGLPGTFAAKYPMNKDFSSFDKFYELRRMEDLSRRQARRIGQEFAQDWVRRNLDYPDATPELRNAFQNLVGIAVAHGQDDSRLTAYYDEFRATTTFCEEHPIFRCEWDVKNTMLGPIQNFHKVYGTRVTVPDHWKWYFGSGTMVPGYRDFACYFGAEWLKRSVGLYFDNAFVKTPAANPWLTSAFWREDGRIQPSTQIWAKREYVKRIWVLHQQLRLPETPQIMMMHMTNAHIVPWESFNEVNLDLEWKFGARPFQAKFSPELLRAESIGRQTGCIPMAISDVEKDGATASETAYALARRTRWGGFVVHEMRMEWSGQTWPQFLVDFGYGLEDCTVYNYWDDKAPFRLDDDRCKWLLAKRGEKLLLVLCTWRRRESTVACTFDLDALGVRPTQVVDVEHPGADEADALFAGALEDLGEDDGGMALPETGMEAKAEKLIRDPNAWQGPVVLDPAAGTLRVPLASYGVRVLRLE